MHSAVLAVLGRLDCVIGVTGRGDMVSRRGGTRGAKYPDPERSGASYR